MWLKTGIFTLMVITAISICEIPDSFGHGLGTETMPPITIDGKSVTLEVGSSTGFDTGIQQITITLFETGTEETIKNTSFEVELIKGEESLFINSFERDDGILIMNLVPSENQDVEIINQDIRYIDMKKREDIDIENFSNFFPIATKIDANTYKKLMWGIPDTFKNIDVAVKKEFMISTRLNTLDGRNLIDELIFSFNNNKQEYKLIFLDRKFFEENTKL